MFLKCNHLSHLFSAESCVFVIGNSYWGGSGYSGIFCPIRLALMLTAISADVRGFQFKVPVCWLLFVSLVGRQESVQIMCHDI